MISHLSTFVDFFFLPRTALCCVSSVPDPRLTGFVLGFLFSLGVGWARWVGGWVGGWMGGWWMPDTSLWEEVNTSGEIPSIRSCPSWCKDGDNVYVFGGYDGVQV